MAGTRFRYMRVQVRVPVRVAHNLRGPGRVAEASEQTNLNKAPWSPHALAAVALVPTRKKDTRLMVFLNRRLIIMVFYTNNNNRIFNTLSNYNTFKYYTFEKTKREATFCYHR